jgi:hypothetical protein
VVRVVGLIVSGKRHVRLLGPERFVKRLAHGVQVD